MAENVLAGFYYYPHNQYRGSAPDREKATNNKTRVLLADDHQVVLDALNDMLSLESDFQVVGTESDGLRAIDSALRLKPDVIVLDISMPGCNGLSAIQAIRRQLTSQRILILTVSEQIEDLARSLQYGAQGYLLKRDSIRDIVSAVRKIASGEIVLSNRLLIRLISAFRQNQDDWENVDATDRQILQLCESGLALASIAGRLCIPETRVRSGFQLFLKMVSLRFQHNAETNARTDYFSRKEV